MSKALAPLMFQNTYNGPEQDCTASGPTSTLRVTSRRLNLLPTTEPGIAAVFDPLFAGLDARRTVAVLNVGLWYGPKLTEQHEPFEAALRAQRSTREQVSRAEREAAAMRVLGEGIGAFLRVACRRGSSWPRILWREHLPQHFAGGGFYSSSPRASMKNASTRCTRLSERAANQMYARAAQPAVAAMRAAAKRDPSRCRVGVLPAFWPLVARHMDHEGFRDASRKARRRRPDCTHFLPCSGSMMYLNQVLLLGVRRAMRATA